MESTFDFQAFNIRGWLKNGMLSLLEPSPVPKSNLKRKGLGSSSMLAAMLVSLNIAAVVHAPCPPGQSALIWPTPPTAAFTKQALMESLKKIRSLGADWTGHSSPTPAAQSIKVAEAMVPLLPDVVADAQAGVDADGNVYLRFKKGQKIAYLTVESNLMHLLVMTPGAETVYIDAEQHRGKKLPSKIRVALEGSLLAS